MSDFVSILGVKGGPAIRPGSNMPTSILVRLGGKTVLVDAGLGVSRGLCDQDVRLTEIDMILITHLHSDHYLELGPLLHTAWTAGLNRKVPIIGPRGLNAYWAGFLASMKFDIDLRIEDEGRNDLKNLVDISEIQDGAVYSDENLTIRSMRNLHPPIVDSFALRFEAGNRSVVLSGDTAYMPEMSEFARGADLLVHEAMLTDGVDALIAGLKNKDDRLKTHILRSPTSAADVGRIATEAGVRTLALNHFVPDGLPGFTDQDWAAAVKSCWSGPLIISKDGQRIEI